MAVNDLVPESPPPTPGGDPAVVDVTAAGDVFDALSSGTARDVFAALYDDPRPVSELADAVGTSLQNVDYHLDRLEAAGLVEVADTRYSSKGVQMDVYAPVGGALVVVAGDADPAVTDAVAEHTAGDPTDDPAVTGDGPTDDPVPADGRPEEPAPVGSD
jgi:DNA-binding transcriptional ArsR family regulator